MEKSNQKAPMRIANPEFIRTHREQFGAKTLTLAILDGEGYTIPRFVAIPASQVFHIVHQNQNLSQDIDQREIEKLAQEAHALVGAETYAVRSSAFVEDGKHDSHAGEFLTKIEVSPENLGDAIISVLRDALTKGQANQEYPFSLIIQEYIPADVAGVIFTRNPLGGREAVIEWRNGRAQEVVGGSSVSRAYVNSDARVIPNHFPKICELFHVARRIEKEFSAPQDIEWAVKEGKLYILQCRPITTFTQNAFVASLAIDKEYASKSNYYISRKGMRESFDSCTPLALDILRFIYGADGPITQAYRSLGVDMRASDNFLQLHGALYVDQELELQQFFPAYGYVPTEQGMLPKIVRFRGLWKTIVHTYQLSHLSFVKPEIQRLKIAAHVALLEAEADKSHEVDEILALVTQVYQDIFTTNLFAEDIFRRASASLTHVPFPLATLLVLPVDELDEPHKQLLSQKVMQMMRGNSLNIADQEKFVSNRKTQVPTAELLLWWNACSKKERAEIAKWIAPAKAYQSIREDCRHLSVLLMSMLRASLVATQSCDERLIYFANIDELRKQKMSNDALNERRAIFEAGILSEMPTVISAVPPVLSSTALGVSAGTASGFIAHKGENFPEHAILLTDRLSPDLAPNLHKVSGIIANEGGMLSHMAIVAREAGVPVVVDPQAREKIQLGMHVTIDGGTGSIVINKTA